MRKSYITLFIILGTFLLNPSHSKAQANPVNYASKGNNVLFLDNYYTNYLQAIRKDYANKDKYYNENISVPVLGYFIKSYYYQLVKSFFAPIYDTTGLASMDDSISTNREKIEKIIISALADCNKYLHDDSITVYIQPVVNMPGFIVKRMKGITAVTPGPKQILISVDIRVTGWDHMLKYTVAHEFEHAYWTQMHPLDTLNFTMLDYLMFEGRADSYAHFVYPDEHAAWATALNDEKKTEVWNEIKDSLNSLDGSFQHSVMFGGADFPLWSGYCLGYTIAQSVLKNHPELKPIQWANMKPEEFFKLGDYK